jgi:hypothetical protein
MADEPENTAAAGDTEDSLETDLSPHNIVDTVMFGRRLRAQRVLQGFDRVGQLTHILRSRYGIDVSDRTIYAIERGEQMPHLDFVLGVVVALECPVHYFAPAMRHDVWDYMVNSR